MKRFFILLLLLILFNAGYSQCPYRLSVSNADYLELENPISVNDGVVWDESDSFTVEVGFDLPISGGVVSSIGFEPGYGFSLPSESWYNLFLFHWPFGGAFLCDREHDGGESDSPLDYEIVGSPDNRIVKLQWTNAGFVMDMTSSDYFSPTFQDYVNFQIWFYEADGQIEIHFGESSVVNRNSYGYWNSGAEGPWSKFIIGDYMIDIFGPADNPDYEWISNEDIVYGRMMKGIPDEGLVYTFIPDFTASAELTESVEDEISVRWNAANNELLIDYQDIAETRGHVAVYSITGQNLFTGELPQNNKIKIKQSSESLLIVRLAIGNKIITKKLMKGF